jgi:hypothetical protein
LPNGFTQKVKPFFSRKQTILSSAPAISSGKPGGLLHLFIERHIFDAPMFAQHRHLAPSLLRQNRQDA